MITNKFLWTQGAFGMIAEISLDVADSDVHKTVFDTAAPEKYQSAVRFSVNAFVDAYGWKNEKIRTAKITIHSIPIVPSDTTLMALAYVTFRALGEACGIDVESVFFFDDSSGKFSFNQLAGNS